MAQTQHQLSRSSGHACVHLRMCLTSALLLTSAQPHNANAPVANAEEFVEQRELNGLVPDWLRSE